MAAYLKLGDIKGEATDNEHKDWIIIESMSSPVFRSIPEGSRDAQRSRGDTTLGDVVVVRELDKSSTKLQESCANGMFYADAEIHLTTPVGNKQEPYLVYRLKDVIVTSYSFHGNAAGDPPPTEEISLGYVEVEWAYTTIDPETGQSQGSVVGTYRPAGGGR